MEKEEQAIHSCAVHQSAICKKPICEKIEYDPRSYCHSICAKPHQVCEKATCKKFLKSNRQAEENLVCASIRTCYLTRRFGPQQEEYDSLVIRDNWHENGDDINSIQGAKLEKEGPRENSNIDAENPDKLTRKLLEELVLHLDEEKVSNIITLGRSEICPCCTCTICTCVQTEELLDVQNKDKVWTEKDDNQYQQQPAKKNIKGHHLSKTSSSFTNKLKKVETFDEDEDLNDDEKIGDKFVVHDSIKPNEDTQKKEQNISKQQQGKNEKSTDSNDKFQGSISEEVDKKKMYQENILPSEKTRPKSPKKSLLKRSKIQGKISDYSENNEIGSVQRSSDDNNQNAAKFKKADQLQEEEKIDKKVSEQGSSLGNEKVKMKNSNTKNYNQKAEKDKQKERAEESMKYEIQIQEGKRTQSLKEKEKVTSPNLKTDDYNQKEENITRKDRSLETETFTRENSRETKSPSLRENVEETIQESNEGKNSQINEKTDDFVDKIADENFGTESQRIENHGTTDRREKDPYMKQTSSNIVDEKMPQNRVVNENVDESVHDAKNQERIASEKNVAENVNEQLKISVDEKNEFLSEDDFSKTKKPIDISSAVTPRGPISTTPEISVPPLSVEAKPATKSVEDFKSENELYVEEMNSKLIKQELDSRAPVAKNRKSSTSASSANRSKQTKKLKNKNSLKPFSPQEKIVADEFNEYEASMSESLEEAIPKEVSLSDDVEAKQKEYSSHISEYSGEDSTDLEDRNPVVPMPDGDICECVPGYCTCGTQHYIFKGLKESEESHRTTNTPTRKISAKRKYERKDSRDSISNASSCSCIHESSLHDIDVNPKLSRVEVVALPPEKKTQMKVPKPSCKPPRYQRTLLIIKPEAVKFQDIILRAIKKKGLDIIDERFIQLTPEQVAEIYTENFGSSYFALFVQQMSSSPILVLSIGGFNSLERWSEAIGDEKKIPSSWFYPPSVKRRFSIHKDIYDAMRLSDDFESGQIEIRYFFPLSIIDPIIVNSFEVQDYCDKFIHPTLLKGLHNLAKSRPPDPLVYLAEWLLVNNPYQPHFEQKQVALAPT